MGNLKALALGVGIALVGALPAQADLIIRADTGSGFSTIASSPNNDITSFTGLLGTFNANVVSSTGVDNLPGTGTLMDNGSLNVSTAGAGSLVLQFIETDLTSASASLSFFGDFTGLARNISVTKSFYADATNSGATTTLLGTISGTTGTFTSGPVALSGPYSITEVITITALGGGAGFLSSDDAIHIPEPLSLGLFGTALIGLGLVRRRRQTQPA